MGVQQVSVLCSLLEFMGMLKEMSIQILIYTSCTIKTTIDMYNSENSLTSEFIVSTFPFPDVLSYYQFRMVHHFSVSRALHKD